MLKWCVKKGSFFNYVKILLFLRYKNAFYEKTSSLSCYCRPYALFIMH